MKRSVILILLLITAYGRSPALGATELREAVTVNSGVVRLGDIFTSLGKAGEVVIATAPTPGKKKVLSAIQLASTAREHGLDWVPATRRTNVVIERASRLIPIDEIETAVLGALTNAGLDGKHKVILSNPRMRSYAAADQFNPFEIENARYDLRAGRFFATLKIDYGAGATRRTPLVGRLMTSIKVPVPTRRIAEGEVVSRDDLEWIEIKASHQRRKYMTDADAIIGKAPRRALLPGRPIGVGAVRAPIIIRKGSLAMVTLRTRNMLLSAKVRAVEDGAKGDTIRVVNTRSKKVIEGIVSGPGRITIPGAERQIVENGS